MSIPKIPTLPAAVSYAQLGGEKQDYQPIVDPTTDTPAAVNNAVKLLSAQSSRVVPRAWVAFGALPGDDPFVDDSETVWDAPPSPTPPNIQRVGPGQGNYSITFPASVTVDGVVIPLNLRFAIPTTTKPGCTVHAVVASPNQITLKHYEDGAIVTSDPGAGERITLMVR